MSHKGGFDDYMESIQATMDCFATIIQCSDMSGSQRLEAMKLAAETAQKVAEAHVYMS